MIEQIIDIGPTKIAADPADKADTHLDGKVLTMMAGDINSGQLTEVESIEEPLPVYELDDLDKILYEKSVKYRVAKDVLFHKNQEGEHIRNLRILLLQGVTQDYTGGNLENKIMQNGDDFTADEINEFRDQIAELVSVRPETVKDWLVGDTVSPGDHNDYFELAKINPTFKKIGEAFDGDGGYKQRYRDYVDSRSLLRKYMLNGYKWDVGAKGDLTVKGEFAPKTGRFVDEIAILDAECQRKDPKKGLFRANATVKKKDDVSPNRDIKLSTGQTDNPKMSPNELFAKTHVYETALNDMLNSYLIQHISQHYMALKPFVFSNLISHSDVEERIMGINAKTDSEFLARFGDKEHLYKLFDEFTNHLDIGLVDERMRSEKGTARKLIDAVQEYRNGSYDSFHKMRQNALELYYSALMVNPYIKKKKQKVDMPHKEIREAFLDVYFMFEDKTSDLFKDPNAKQIVKKGKDSIRKMKFKHRNFIEHFEKDYGYVHSPKMFLNTFVQQMGDERARLYFNPRGYNQDILQQDLQKEKVTLYSRGEVEGILITKGIPDAMKYLDQGNFAPLNPFR